MAFKESWLEELARALASFLLAALVDLLKSDHRASDAIGRSILNALYSHGLDTVTVREEDENLTSLLQNALHDSQESKETVK